MVALTRVSSVILVLAALICCEPAGPTDAGDAGDHDAGARDSAAVVVDAGADGGQVDATTDGGQEDAAGCSAPCACHVDPPQLDSPPLLSAGSHHSCAVLPDNSLWCWGRNPAGELGIGTFDDCNSPVRVVDQNDWAVIAVSGQGDAFWGGHTCATKLDGTLWCWGANNYSQLGDVATHDARVSTPMRMGDAADWLLVEAGANHTCAIDANNDLWCWGFNKYGQLGDDRPDDPDGNYRQKDPVLVAEPGPWFKVDVGDTFTCAIRLDGTLWCWGRLDPHDLVGTYALLVPGQVGEACDWSDISTGSTSFCAVKLDGTLWCKVEADAELEQVGSASDWVRVSVNGAGLTGQGTCAINSSDELWCWQSAADLLLDSPELVPAPGGETVTWTGVARGKLHTCATLSDATIWCWGNNEDGELGVGSGGWDYYSSPIAIEQQQQWLAIDAGLGANNCGIQSDHSVWCLGTTPELLVDAASETWAHVSSGDDHLCLIAADEALWCAGSRSYGQLGDGVSGFGSEAAAAPVGVLGAGPWDSVSAGIRYTCAVTAAGELYCWGWNSDGQLGIGTSDYDTDHDTPERVGADSDWSSVTGRDRHTCGIRDGGALYCWGRNTFGQLGDGTSDDTATPTPVTGSQVWAQVSAGYGHTCAIDDAGQLWCAGLNRDLQLGNDSAGSQVLTLVDAAGAWSQVSAGDKHTCATKVDHTLWCWGNNENGQLGIGMHPDEVSSSLPAQVGTQADWQRVTAGEGYTCALKDDQSLWCWGKDRRIGTRTAYIAEPTQVL